MKRSVYRALAFAAVVAGLGVHSSTRVAAGAGSITITGCSSPCVLKAGPDFATDVFADPWDFNERTDAAIDPAQVTVSSFSVSGGKVSGTASNSSGHFAMLEQPWNGIINPGKTGRKFTIDPTKYTKLAVKMTAGDGARHPRVYWFHNDIGQTDASGWRYFDSVNMTPAGDGIYVMDLTQAQGGVWNSGAVEGLVFYPNDQDTSPFNFSFDWVRLTTADNNLSSAIMTFSWSGGGGDITVTDGTATYTVAKGANSSGSMTWNYGVLPPGTYTLSVGGSASQTFRVNSPPLIHVTDPDEGGGADFATDVLRNAWDMNDVNDVFKNVNIVNHLISETFTSGVYNGTSDGVAVCSPPACGVPVGDPQVYLLSNQKTSNMTDIIDSTKYHRLTFDMTHDRAFDLGLGSMMRVMWGSDSSDSLPGGTPYNVTISKDIIAWPGKNTYTIDLSTLTTANSGLEATASATPWTQKAIRHFRIDPHEFAEQVTFHMDNVKLAADDETSNGAFTIRWTGSDADPGDSPIVTLYYQAVGGSPNLITSGIPLSTGQYTWGTNNSIPAGTYYILAVVSDAYNETRQYSTGPLKVVAFTPTSNPFINVDTPQPNQTVTSAFEVGGWILDAAAPSGTGVDEIQFYVQPPSDPAPGVFIGKGKLGLSRPDVAAIFGSQFTNSGFHFTITGMGPGNFTLGVYGHSTVTNAFTIVKTVPITVSAKSLMSVDVPSAEQVIANPTFGISGWAIDRDALSGTGVDAVHIYAYRNPGSGEPAIFLGVASLGISRPDVGALYGGQFTPSGYVLNISRSAAGLTPGTYNLVAWAHSSVTGTFTTFALVQVELQ